MLPRRSTLGAAAFATVCVGLTAFLCLGNVGSAPANDGLRLAQAGATIGLAAIVAVVLLLIAGMIFIVVGRRRNRDDTDEDANDAEDSGNPEEGAGSPEE